MIHTVPRLGTVLLFALCSCAGNHQEKVGFYVSLLPPCRQPPQHRSFTDFMGSSVALELHAASHPTINGDEGQGRPWVALLQEIFSTRSNKTLLLVPDNDVPMGQIVTVLDRLQEAFFLHKIILLTPKQGNDIRDEFCIMDEPA